MEKKSTQNGNLHANDFCPEKSVFPPHLLSEIYEASLMSLVNMSYIGSTAVNQLEFALNPLTGATFGVMPLAEMVRINQQTPRTKNSSNEVSAERKTQKESSRRRRISSSSNELHEQTRRRRTEEVGQSQQIDFLNLTGNYQPRLFDSTEYCREATGGEKIATTSQNIFYGDQAPLSGSPKTDFYTSNNQRTPERAVTFKTDPLRSVHYQEQLQQPSLHSNHSHWLQYQQASPSSSRYETPADQLIQSSSSSSFVHQQQKVLRNQRHRQKQSSQIARGIFDFARGLSNSRNPRRSSSNLLQPSISRSRRATSRRSISPAYPLNSIYLNDEDMRPYKFDVILQLPQPSKQEMEQNAWNPDDRSLNIYVKEEDFLTFHRHPVAQSTDCIRGKVGYSRGFHVWELTWPLSQRGTHAVIGVSTKKAPLHIAGYTSLVGSNTESYGWDIIENKCYHDHQNIKGWSYPMLSSNGLFQAPERIFCILDMDEGYLAFATESRYLGIAFRGLKGLTLWPMVSAVWGHCEVTIRYLGGLDPEPRHLMDICRRKIRLEMGRDRLHRISELNLPPMLARYILYR